MRGQIKCDSYGEPPPPQMSTGKQELKNKKYIKDFSLGQLNCSTSAPTLSRLILGTWTTHPVQSIHPLPQPSGHLWAPYLPLFGITELFLLCGLEEFLQADEPVFVCVHLLTQEGWLRQLKKNPVKVGNGEINN